MSEPYEQHRAKIEGATTTQTNKSPPPECHLLKIPPELRLIIYDDVLSDFTLAANGDTSEDTITHPPLLDTCTLIRDEAYQPYFNGMITILLDMKDHSNMLRAGLAALEPEGEQVDQSGVDSIDVLSKLVAASARISEQCERYLKFLEVVLAEVEKWEKLGYWIKMPAIG